MELQCYLFDIFSLIKMVFIREKNLRNKSYGVNKLNVFLPAHGVDLESRWY